MKRPFVTLKYAQTLDGKIATRTNDSKWISGKEARVFVHRLRARHDAILVGINTVICDDPKLTVRHVAGKNPIRVIFDSKLRIPLDSYIVKSANKIETIIFTALTDKEIKKSSKVLSLNAKNIKVISCLDNKSKQINIKRALAYLYESGIKTLFVEGGSSIITSFLKEKLVDQLFVVISPCFIGEGVAACKDLGITMIKDALKFKVEKVMKKGQDYILCCKLV